MRSAFYAGSASSAVRTYEAILRGIVPKVTLKLGSAVLPMRTEAQFPSFFGAVLMIGPESASPVTSQQGVTSNFVKLVKAAVAFWHVVRGDRAFFDAEWTPRIGIFWYGVKKVAFPLDNGKNPVAVLGRARIMPER